MIARLWRRRRDERPAWVVGRQRIQHEAVSDVVGWLWTHGFPDWDRDRARVYAVYLLSSRQRYEAGRRAHV